jgi:hypothetical protein
LYSVHFYEVRKTTTMNAYGEGVFTFQTVYVMVTARAALGHVHERCPGTVIGTK